MSDEDGDRAGKTDLAARAADAARKRLRPKQTAVLAVHVLGNRRGDAHVAVIFSGRSVARGGDFPIHCGIGLVAVYGNGDAHGNIVGILVKHRHRRAGTQRAVIGAIFRVDLYGLRREAAADLSRGNVLGHGRARRSGDVDLLPFLRARIQRLTSRAAGVASYGIHGAGRRTGRGRISGQGHVELLHQHGEQRHAGNGVCARLHGGTGVTVDLVHDHVVQRRRLVANAERAEQIANAAEVAVEVRTDHGRQAGSLVLVGGERLHLRFAGDDAVAEERRTHIRIGKVNAHSRADRSLIAHRKAGGRAVGLTALERAQVEVNRLDIRCVNVRLRLNDIAAVQAHLRARTDDGMHHIVDHRKRHRGVNGDILGRSVVLVDRHLAERRHIQRHLVAAGDRIAAGDGDGVDIVAGLGNDAQSARLKVAVFAKQRMQIYIQIGNGSGRTNADALSLRVASAVLVLIRHAVFVRRGGSGGIHFLRALRINGYRARHVDVRRAGSKRLIGNNGLGIRLYQRDGRSAGNANVRSARAGNGGGGHKVAHAVQFARVAELDVQGGDHHVADALNGHFRGEAILGEKFVHFALRLAGKQAEQERWLGKHLHEGIDNGIGQRAKDRLGGIDRFVAELRGQQINDHCLQRRGVARVYRLISFFELSVIGQHFLQARIALCLDQGVKQHTDALGIGKVLHQVRKDGLYARLVLCFEDVGANGQRVGAQIRSAEICSVVVTNIVDSDAHAHASRRICSAGVSGDDGIRIHQGSHGHIAVGFDRGVIADAGRRIVFENVERKRCGNLHAAFLRLRAGAILRKRRNGRGVDVVGSDAGGKRAGGLCVQICDLIRLALLIQRADVRAARSALAGKRFINLILRAGRGLALLLLLLLKLIRRLGTGGACRGRSALGTGNDLLVKATDGLRIHHYIARRGAALKGGSGRVVEDTDAKRAADADARAHGRGVHLHGALHLAIGGNRHIATSVDLLIRGAKVRLRIHTADAQGQYRHYGRAAGRAGRGFNVLRTTIGSVYPRRGERKISERHAILDARGDVYANQPDRDAGANASGIGRHLVCGLEGNNDAAKSNAAALALSGGVAYRDVATRAGGIHAHLAAVNRIGSALAHQRIVDRRGQMHGNRAAQTKVCSRGNMAGLDDHAGSRVPHVGVYKQTLGGNCAASDFGHIVVVEIGNANSRADRLLRRILGRQARHGVNRRRSVQRSVGAQFRVGFATGEHIHCAGSLNIVNGGDAGGVIVVDICQRESACELLPGLLRLIDHLNRLVEEALDARSAADQIAQRSGDIHLDAKQLLDHADGFHRRNCAGCLRVGGDVDRHRIGMHAGSGIQADVARERQNAGRIKHLNRRIVLNKRSGNVHARCRLRRQRLGGLARREGTGGHRRIGDQVHAAIRFDSRVVLHRHMRIHQRHGKGNRKFRYAAHGIGRDAGIGISIQVRVGARLNQRVAGDCNGRFTNRNAHSHGDDHAGHAVGGIDENIQFAANAHGAFSDDLAQNIDGRVAHLQNEGLQFEVGRKDAAGQIRNGEIALAQGKAGKDVHRLGRFKPGVFADRDAAIALRLVQTDLEAHVVLAFGEIVVNDGQGTFDHDVVRADGLQKDVLAGHFPIDLNALAGNEHVHARGQQTINGDLAVIASIVYDIGEQQTIVRNRQFGNEVQHLVGIDAHQFRQRQPSGPSTGRPASSSTGTSW